MNASRMTLSRLTLVRAAIAVLFAANVVLVLGGAVFAGVGQRSATPTVSPETVDSLRARVATLEGRVAESAFIGQEKAQARALTILTLAEEDYRIEVLSMANSTEQQRIGQRDHTVFVTSLDLQGRRDDVLALLRELPETFDDNLLMDAVDAHGTADAWRMRIVLRQVVHE